MTTLLGPFTQLVTMRNLPTSGPLADDQLEVIADGGLVIDGGRIVELGKHADLTADDQWEVKQPTVALPGLIDSHTHICWAGNRSKDYAKRLSGVSYQEIAATGGGILDTVRHTRAESRQRLAHNIEEHAAALMRQGVTSCEVKSGYGLSFDAEVKMLESIQLAAERTPVRLIPTCLAAHCIPPEATSADTYLDEVIDKLLPHVWERGLARRVDVFVEDHAFNVEQSRRYLEAARALGFTLTIHADQFTAGGAALAAEVGAVSADHLEAIPDEVMPLLAKADVIATVLPGATLGLGQHFPPARKLLDAGTTLVIASDWNPGSAPQGLLVAQAALLGAAEKLTMAETLAAITCRAARALSLDDCGRLDEGLRADIALFPTGDYRDILYHQGALQPHLVVTEGKQNSLHL